MSDYWVSEKYDSVWNGQQLVFRGGNIYHTPAWFIKGFPKQKPDAELYISRQSFKLFVGEYGLRRCTQ